MAKIKKIKPGIGFIGPNRENILDDLNFAIKNGFDYYEIQAARESTIGENFNLKPEIINQSKRISRENNISLILHASHFKDLCSITPEISKAALEFAKREIFLANKIGAKQVTIHAGHRDLSEKETIITKNFNVIIENLREIVELGTNDGIEIGLENSLSDGLCREVKDLLKVIDSVKGLKVVFDTGHANTINLNPIYYFKKLKNFIVDIHIHDNNGKSDQHALIGEGNIDFKTLLKECKNSGYYGPFILELFPYKNVLEGKKRFLNTWNQV